MIKVWILVAMFGGDGRGYGGVNGPLVVDNIVSKAECERLAENIKHMISFQPHNSGGSLNNIYSSFQCIEIAKKKRV